MGVIAIDVRIAQFGKATLARSRYNHYLAWNIAYNSRIETRSTGE
jgi:hypothetical protein